MTREVRTVSADAPASHLRRLFVRGGHGGYPVVDPGPVPPALDRDARRAVAACPALALKLTRSEQPARSG